MTVFLSSRLGGARAPPPSPPPPPVCLSVSVFVSSVFEGTELAGSVGRHQVLVVVVSASLWGAVCAVLGVLTVSPRPAPFLLRGRIQSQIYHRAPTGRRGRSSRHAHGAASRFARQARAAVGWRVTVCFRNACRQGADVNIFFFMCSQNKDAKQQKNFKRRKKENEICTLRERGWNGSYIYQQQDTLVCYCALFPCPSLCHLWWAARNRRLGTQSPRCLHLSLSVSLRATWNTHRELEPPPRARPQSRAGVVSSAD